jgi:hypothetical protein
MPPTLPRTAWRALTLLLASTLAAADPEGASPDPAVVARQALAALEQGRQYAWEFRDLDGEVDNKTVWVGADRPADAWENSNLNSPRATAWKKKIRTFSPTVQGQFRADGWAVTEAGFAAGPRIVAVLHPSGARVVRMVHSGKTEWLTAGKFQSLYGPGARRLTDPKDQMAYSACWAAMTSPVPHELLTLLLRDASQFRFEQDEIFAEISAASARLLLGSDSPTRKLAPDRFKGNARLRIRDGVLRECRIQLDYDVDLTAEKQPSNENIDVLILFRGPLAEPVLVPDAARAALPAE